MTDKKRALVTGGSGALGGAICERLAADGFEVYIHANSALDSAKTLEQKIIAAGGSAKALQFDVTDAQATLNVLQPLADDKAFQVVVNCAGIHNDAVFAGMSASTCSCSASVMSIRAQWSSDAKTRSCSRVHTVELLPCAGRQRVEVDVFDRRADSAVAVLAGAALRLPDANPVGGAIAGTAEALALDKRFEQMHGMSVSRLPISGQPSGDAPQQVAGQMGHADPGQDQKATIVDQQRQAARAGGVVPTNPAVAGLGLPGRRAEKQAGKFAAQAVTHQVGDVFSDRAAKAQVMMARQIKREECAVARSRRHRFQAQWLKIRQRLGDGGGQIEFVFGDRGHDE